MANTNFIITAKDATGPAFASAANGLAGLAAKATAVTSAITLIGGAASISGFVAFTRQTINAQDELSKLSQKTGIAVESLAGLEFAAEQSGVELDKVAKATRAFTLLVAEAGDASSESAKKLAQLGLSYKDLKDLSPEKQLLALADALTKFSEQDRAVAFTSVFGQKMADLIPLLSSGSKGLAELIEQGKKLNPVTAESAKKAEQFNDQLNLLNKSVSALGREALQGLIPGLARVTDEMVRVTQQSGLLAGAFAGVKQLFVESFGNPKILGDVGTLRREIIKTKETIDQLSTKKDSVFFDNNALQHEKEKLADLEGQLQKAIGTSRDVIKAKDDEAESQKRFGDALAEAAKKQEEAEKGKQNAARASGEAAKKRKEEIDAAYRIESDYVKLLTIERKALVDLVKPFSDSAKSAVDQVNALRQNNEALELSRSRQISLEAAIQLTTIARLEEKKVTAANVDAVAQIDKEIAARKEMVQIIQTGDAKKAGDDIRKSELQAYEQFSVQAARNIQTNLAQGIRDGFQNGFKSGIQGLLVGLADTASRIVSEVLAAKLLQSSGVGGSLGLFNAASNGLSLASAARGGFGLNGLVGGGLSRLGGVAGAFGGGLAGSSAGIFSNIGGAGTAFIGGPGTALGGAGLGGAATAGASFASLAGPVAALAAGFLGGRALAGDKKIAGIGGTEAALIGTALGGPIGAVVGGAILKLFGRGPFKFRQQSFQGEVSASGFEGDFTNVERAKGGLLRSNAHRSTSEALSKELDDTLDTTLKSFFAAGKEFAKNLSLPASLVNNFTTEIQVKSEKGKRVTAEAIDELIATIPDKIAESLLPTVAQFAKTGEGAAQTLTRLNAEFVSLTQAAQNLGASSGFAKRLVDDLGFSARTAFVDQVGGIEALAEKSAFFFNSFLEDTEKVPLMVASLGEQLEALGVSASLTKEQFKGLVQAVGTSNELRIGLLNLQEEFLNTRNASKALEDQLKQNARTNLDSAFSALQESVGRERDKLTDSYNKSLAQITTQISSVTSNVARLRSLSDALKNTANAINPISLDDARKQIQDAIKSGVTDLDSLRPALDKLGQNDTSGFSTRTDFLRSQGVSAGLVNKLGEKTEKQLSVAEKSLRALEGTRDTLGIKFDQQLSRLDSLVTAAQDEAKATQGLSTALLSLVQALGGFNRAISGAGGTPVDPGGLVTGGNPSISSKDIVNFANVHTPLQTYREAIKRGVSSDQIVASGKYTRAEIDKFLKDNKLPSFDVGGIVPRTSLALVHKGERVINPQQNEAIVELLGQILLTVQASGGDVKATYQLLKNMTNDGLALNTKTAA